MNLTSLQSDFCCPFLAGKNLSAYFVVECSLTIFGENGIMAQLSWLLSQSKL